MAAHPLAGRTQLPAHLALRIALAARELNGVDNARLLRALLAISGEPITEARLGKLRVARLRAQLLDPAGDELSLTPSERQLQRAVSLLKGRGVRMPEEPLPVAEPYRDGELADSVRIACASDQGECLDGSFGRCARYLIYQVSPSSSRLIALREPGSVAADEDRHARRAALLQDCQLLYTLSIGGPAAAKVVPFRFVTPRAGEHFKTCVPLVSLRAAASNFSNEQFSWDQMGEWADEWVSFEPKTRFEDGMFVARIRGDSMEPILSDRFIVVVDHTQRDPAGLRGRMVAALVQEGVLVKWLARESRLDRIILRSQNPTYEDILLDSPETNPIIGDVVFWWGTQEKAGFSPP